MNMNVAKRVMSWSDASIASGAPPARSASAMARTRPCVRN